MAQNKILHLEFWLNRSSRSRILMSSSVCCPRCWAHCVPGLYLLQEASALAGHGEVSQEREGELLDRAVVWGNPWGQLHDRVHQGVANGAFRSWCNSKASATETTTCWERKKKKNNHRNFFRLTWSDQKFKTGFRNIAAVRESINHLHTTYTVTCVYRSTAIKAPKIKVLFWPSIPALILCL